MLPDLSQYNESSQETMTHKVETDEFFFSLSHTISLFLLFCLSVYFSLKTPFLLMK